MSKLNELLTEMGPNREDSAELPEYLKHIPAKVKSIWGAKFVRAGRMGTEYTLHFVRPNFAMNADQMKALLKLGLDGISVDRKNVIMNFKP